MEIWELHIQRGLSPCSGWSEELMWQSGLVHTGKEVQNSSWSHFELIRHKSVDRSPDTFPGAQECSPLCWFCSCPASTEKLLLWSKDQPENHLPSSWCCFRSFLLREPGIHPLLVFNSSAGSSTSGIFPEAGESPWRPLPCLCTLGPGINPAAMYHKVSFSWEERSNKYENCSQRR